MRISIVDRAYVGDCELCGRRLFKNTVDTSSIFATNFANPDNALSCARCGRTLCGRCAKRTGWLPARHMCPACAGSKDD